MIKKVVGIICLAAVGATAQAQVRKYSNEFLQIGVGAKALGMAGTQVSQVNDVTAGYWNPAGLNAIEGNIQAGLMHAEYFAGIAKYDYGSIAARIDRTSVASASFVRFAIDDIPDTSELIDASGQFNFDRIKSFSSADYAFMFSYAKESSYMQGLQLGGTAKIIYRGIGDYAKAYGFGFDIGAQLQREKYSIGIVGRDITSTFNAWTFNVDKLKYTFQKTGNEIPQNGLELTLPRIIAGGSYRYDINPKTYLLGAADLDFTFDGKRNTVVKTSIASIDPHVGLEAGYDNLVFIRAGVGNIQQVKNIGGTGTSTIFQPNVGVGLRIKQFYIDYAYTNIGQKDVPYSHIVSLKLDIYRSAPIF